VLQLGSGYLQLFLSKHLRDMLLTTNLKEGSKSVFLHVLLNSRFRHFSIKTWFIFRKCCVWTGLFWQ